MASKTKLVDNTQLFKTLISKAIEDASNEIGITGVAELQANCPVGNYPRSSGRTGGTLRRSLTFKKANRKDKYVITFGSPIDYAPYTELRPNVKTKGWMRNTMRDFTSDVKLILIKHLNKVGR